MSNETNIEIDNEMNKVEQAEAALAQAVSFDDLSDEELEARISKEQGGGFTAYC